jgi:HK97 family phage portal protein
MAVVVSEGAISTIAPTWTPLTVNGSVGLYEGRWSDYAAIWKTQPNVRFVIGFIARNVAQVGLKTYRRISNIEREELTDHPAAEVLRRPQPRPYKLTQYRMIEHLTACLGIYDNSFTIKVQVGGSDRMALVPAPPWAMGVTGKNWLRPEGYELTLGGRVTPFDPDQIVHCHGFNPLDSRVGVSPMETLRRILAEEESAGQWREQFWRQAGRQEAIIKRPADVPQWSPDARARFKAEWEAMYSGAGGSGRTAILEEGMELVPMSWSAKDSQYLEARKLTREEVAAAFYVWPAMVGIMDEANYAVISQVRPMLYTDVLGPTFQSIQQDLNHQLLPDFPDSDDLYCEFNIGEKLKGSFEEQAQFAQASVGGPWVTRNEQRARFNLPPVDGGNELIVPLNVLIGGQASPQDSAPPPKGLADALGSFLDRQARTVASKRGAGKAWWDATRWDNELARDLSPWCNGSARDTAEEVNRATKALLDGGIPDTQVFGPDRRRGVADAVMRRAVVTSAM